MIPPREQWAIQIDVTNACPRSCSNCTRFCGHHKQPYFMEPFTFRKACEALADFPTKSTPGMRRKVIGVMGGEPLLHPLFEHLVDIACEVIPDPQHRGLWTSLHWQNTRHRQHVERLLCGDSQIIQGYLNQNEHEVEVRHHPILVAIREVIRDEAKMWSLINDCPLQEIWSGAITPKGFFFCEVAASMDMLFDGPGGLPIEPGCWSHDLEAYREQIERWCPRCGIPLKKLAGRVDKEERDDITHINATDLMLAGSERLRKHEIVVYNPADYPADGPERDPLRYRP